MPKATAQKWAGLPALASLILEFCSLLLAYHVEEINQKRIWGHKNAVDAQGSTIDIFLESKKYKRKDIQIVQAYSYLLEKV